MLERKKGLNPNILLGIVVVLVIVIAVMGFFLGRMSAGDGVSNGKNNGNVTYEELKTIKVIKDARDVNSMIPYEMMVEQLKALPSTAGAEFQILDFSDKGIEAYLRENDIMELPAFIFSTKNFDTSNDPTVDPATGQVSPAITNFLVELPSGGYSLIMFQPGSGYNPFNRTARGFKQLTQEQFSRLSDVGSYVDGNENSRIIWFEFSDLQCPYCAKLYSDGTPAAIRAKYGDDISVIFNHFPLSFHPNAIPAAEVAECLATQKGSSAFYALIEVAFKNNNILNGSDVSAAKKFMIDEAVKLGANKATLEACVDANTYSAKIQNQMNVGSEVFGITGTPGNVLVNTSTLEYEILSGAYPASYFEDIINRLLAE